MPKTARAYRSSRKGPGYAPVGPDKVYHSGKAPDNTAAEREAMANEAQERIERKNREIREKNERMRKEVQDRARGRSPTTTCTTGFPVPAPAWASAGGGPGQPAKLAAPKLPARPPPPVPPPFVGPSNMTRPPQSKPSNQEDPGLSGFACLDCKLGAEKSDKRHTRRKDQCHWYHSWSSDVNSLTLGAHSPTTAPPDDLPAYTPYGPAVLKAGVPPAVPTTATDAPTPFSADYSQFYTSVSKA